MNVFAFILAVIAAAVFFADYARSRWGNMVSLGLTILTVAWIVALTAQSSTHVVKF